MTSDQLHYFKVLAETLNFTQAANNLFISQPALSSAITRLEREVGVKLLVRNRSGKAMLTEAGERFYEHACLALADIDNGIQLAREIEYGARNSTLRIGAVPCVQSAAWSRTLNDFRVASPLNPTFSIRQAHSPELTAWLLKGEIDAAFISKVGDDSRISYHLCGRQPVVLCVHRKHPWAKKKSVSLGELDGWEVLTYDGSNPATKAALSVLGRCNAVAQEAFLDEMTMAALVQADPETLAVFCYSLVVEAIPDVVVIPIEGIGPDACNLVYFAYLKVSQRAVASAFIDHMLKYLEAHELLSWPLSDETRC